MGRISQKVDATSKCRFLILLSRFLGQALQKVSAFRLCCKITCKDNSLQTVEHATETAMVLGYPHISACTHLNDKNL
jgi:hypothetical protein